MTLSATCISHFSDLSHHFDDRTPVFRQVKVLTLTGELVERSELLFEQCDEIDAVQLSLVPRIVDERASCKVVRTKHSDSLAILRLVHLVVARPDLATYCNLVIQGVANVNRTPFLNMH